MPTVDTDDLITVTEAGRIGVSGLVKAVEQGGKRVIMRNGRPVAAFVAIDALEEAEKREEGLLDVSLALTRVLTTDKRRHSLDDVLDRFGYTRDDLD